MKSFISFWRVHPGLFLGTALFLGAHFAFVDRQVCLVCLSCFLAPFLLSNEISAKEKSLIAFGSLLLIGASFQYARTLYPEGHIPSPQKGKAYFSIDAVRKTRTPFKMLYCYEGLVKRFENEDFSLKNLSARVYTPVQKNRMRADGDYILEGTLIQKEDYSYIFKPARWKALPGTYSSAEKRASLKEKLKKSIEKIYPQRVSQFLGGLATGDLEDRLLAFEMGQLGLSHLLAISGFHFALLTLFLSRMLTLFLPKRLVYLVLLCCLTGYFIFLGKAPSVCRAYGAILIVLAGGVLGLSSLPLNALGGALCLTLFFDPLLIVRLGFQLSFAATFALLACMPLVESGLYGIFPLRKKEEVDLLGAGQKIFCILSSLCRKAWALNLSVALFTLPIILSRFHKYPLLSLFYNLFIPTALSAILFLFLLGLLLRLVHPLLSYPFEWSVSFLTNGFLDQIEFFPRKLDISFYAGALSSNGALWILIPLILLCISRYRHIDQNS